ncbi:MAG TPA: amidohydrolase family protein [Vicinamibacterales bacterium]|nr:amidohydrolase family protein [Vicinamibacterales bacterium]
MFRRLVCLAVLASLTTGCQDDDEQRGDEAGETVVFRGARLVRGDGSILADRGVLVVRDGRIAAVGREADVAAPDGATVVDLPGRTVVPGLINGHGHVGNTMGFESSPAFQTRDNLSRQLRQYARFGVTTVVSLGGEGDAAARLRDLSTGPLERARLRIAGPVITAATPEAARRDVNRVAALSPDFIKIRVDDNLGTTRKMPLEVARAVIDQAHMHGIRVAAHIFYLDDARALVRAGVDLVAHSVRDQAVDAELISLLTSRRVCVVPTLAREMSAFVYEGEPDFLRDPFLVAGLDASIVETLDDPARRPRPPTRETADRYRAALEVAGDNVGRLVDAGVGVAFGTDSGPPGRFQGYFEHLELEMLVQAGLTPAEALASATRTTADCLGLPDAGDLVVGRWADFVVLGANPLADIRASRSIESVWIGGRRVPR